LSTLEGRGQPGGKEKSPGRTERAATKLKCQKGGTSCLVGLVNGWGCNRRGRPPRGAGKQRKMQKKSVTVKHGKSTKKKGKREE